MYICDPNLYTLDIQFGACDNTSEALHGDALVAYDKLVDAHEVHHADVLMP